jgi:hypothetical protein
MLVVKNDIPQSFKYLIGCYCVNQNCVKIIAQLYVMILKCCGNLIQYCCQKTRSKLLCLTYMFTEYKNGVDGSKGWLNFVVVSDHTYRDFVDVAVCCDFC